MYLLLSPHAWSGVQRVSMLCVGERRIHAFSLAYVHFSSFSSHILEMAKTYSENYVIKCHLDKKKAKLFNYEQDDHGGLNKRRVD